MSLLNRLLGLLLGLLLVSAGLLVVAETVVALLQRPPWLLPHNEWASALDRLTWGDAGVALTATLVLLVGALLVVLQLWPTRPSVLHIVEERADRAAALDGRGVQDLLRRLAVEDEDVADAKVRLSARAARVSGHVLEDVDPRTVQSRIRERLRERIDALRLQRSLKVKVDMSRGKARTR